MSLVRLEVIEWQEGAEAQYQKYGDFQPRYDQLRERGNSMWWYVCCSPQYPYANFFSTYQGTMTRVLFWQQYMYNVDGVLYWAVNDWQGGAEWRTMDCGFAYGDGRLVYCGAKYKIRGPISSTGPSFSP